MRVHVESGSSTRVFRTQGKLQFSPAMKSALCNAVKWRSGEDRFCICVRENTENRELLTWLKKAGPPAATYFAPGGTVVKRHWAFDMGAYSKLWRAVPTELS